MKQQAAREVRYNPLWGAPPRRARQPGWARIAIVLSIAVHGGLVYYIYESKFAPHYQVYQGDSAITAEIMPRAKPTPPAEPPKPPPINREPPPSQPITQHLSSIPLESIAQPTIPVIQPEVPAPPRPLPSEPAKPPGPRMIANPDWSARPSGEDMARYYPERAIRQDKAGNVTLQCPVTAKGAVADCMVLSEDPAGYGFGDAALKLSRLFRMKPRMEDGQAVEGAVVRIPIAFRLD